MSIYKITLLLCFLNVGLNGQIWEDLISIGGENKESATVITNGPGTSIFVGGIYDNPFDWDGMEVPAFGQDDLFLGCLDVMTKEWKWKLTAGSILDDSWAQLTVDEDGNLICVGVFWVDINFGGILLENEVGSKSILVAKINPAGEVLWAKRFDGSALKEVRGVDTDQAGNIYLTGYFRDEIYFGDTTLIANGETAVFVSKLDKNGAPKWARQFGGRKDTRGIGIGTIDGSEIALVGYYNDTTYFDNFSLPAKTFDRDIFVLGLDSIGHTRWAKRAGGVFDEEPLAIKIGSNHDIWITGYLIGVLTLEDGFSIQSTNGTSDLFLLQYSRDGNPMVAKSFGGTSSVQSNGIDLDGNEVVLGGVYKGSINLPDNLPMTGNDEAGFVSAFDINGQPLWARSLHSDESVFVNSVIKKDEKVWVIGSYQGTLTGGEESLVNEGGFDAFIASLTLPPTSTHSPTSSLGLRVFPNPVSDTLFLESPGDLENISLEDAAGKVVFQGQNPSQIDVGKLPAGVYFLKGKMGRTPFSKVILIQH